MKKILFFTFLLATLSLPVFSSVYYVAPDGNDANNGTISQPFLTIQRAQTAVVAGDTVYVRGGTYVMTEAQIASYSSNTWAFVTLLNKSGASGNRIKYWAYPGERPIFDYTNVKPAGLRVNAFEVTGSWIHIKGLEVTGVQVPVVSGNTQSICFSQTGAGGNNIYEQLSMHDGQAIGFYLTRGSNNLILNCDAYRNNDYTSTGGGGVNGGNVDGFGCHPNAAGYVNNVFKGCRAWFNSDDGYDCISAHESTIFDSCWAFYNGYAAGFISRGDGNGFKAGGYGSAAFTALPVNIPRNTIRFCLSVRNKSNGFYSNHHLEGSDWYNNTAYMNASNYNMLNRKAKNSTDYLTDVPGYNHVLKNNISLLPRSAGSDITSYDAAQCVITNNTFLNAGITVTTNDFLSIDTALLVAPRQADGSLPVVNFMRLKPTSNLVDKGAYIGFPYNGAAPDLGAFETGSASLPVEMISFNASVTGSKVLLRWQVATESQNKGWEIERSASTGNNAVWEKIGFVEGKGNSQSAGTYSFTDENVEDGNYGYRLKQIDYDGNTKYSNVQLVRVSSGGLANLEIYPNPIISNATIKYSLPENATVQLSLYTSSGALISTLVNAGQNAGLHQHQLNESLLKAKGNYILRLTVNEKVVSKLFSK